MATAESGISQPLFENGKFGNPFPTFSGLNFSLGDLWRWQREKDRSDIPDKTQLDKILPLQKPDFGVDPRRSGFRATWIGHATVLVQLDEITFLTDPIWSNRCSPIAFMGPKRYRQPPISIQDLPKIDFVIISHNHYDHLDAATVKELQEKFPSIRWYVPMGLKVFMVSLGCVGVEEMTWGESKTFIPVGQPNFAQVVCLPAQHWSGRGLLDRFKTLWCGWAVIGPTRRFFFAGDSGYCGEFSKIGRMYGPFDLAAIPIGCYEPRWFMSPQHMAPEESVKVFKDLRANKALGIHWGTFHMGSKEHYMEPKRHLIQVLESNGISTLHFRAPNHGYTWKLDETVSNPNQGIPPVQDPLLANVMVDAVQPLSYEQMMANVQPLVEPNAPPAPQQQPEQMEVDEGNANGGGSGEQQQQQQPPGPQQQQPAPQPQRRPKSGRQSKEKKV